MASGQPEDKLTIMVRYPNGKMRVHLHEVLARTGKRCNIDRTMPDSSVQHGYGLCYSIGNCRKLFRLMAEWCTEEDLEQADKFIHDRNSKLYREWTNQRTLVRR